MSQLDMSNGMTASQLFHQPFGWTFDDINLLPNFNEGVTKKNIHLHSALADSLILNQPLVSSPMDTVTESQTAIEMALHGGLGVIHMNLPLAQAIEEVQRVKRYQMGIVTDPLCRSPQDPISEVEAVKRKYGFSTLLVTVDGTAQTKLLGLVTKGHAALEPDKTAPLQRVMIPVSRLMTVPAGRITSWSAAREFLRSEPAAHKLPIIRSNGSVAGFITRKDVEKMSNCPHALTHPETGQLRIGIAVSTHERDDERVEALIAAGVDVIIIDSAQGSTSFAVRRIQQIRQRAPTIPIVAGNVVTPSQAEPLVAAGAHALRVGMGSGSICTTQNVVGTGRAQLSAVYHLACHFRGQHVPIIADGGIRSSADVIKALTCGATAVMVGRLIVGCNETPAQLEIHQGRRYKRYRGMGSTAAIRQGGHLRYGHDIELNDVVAQGIEGLVPAEGSLSELLHQLDASLRTGLEYLGCSSITELHTKVDSGDIRFELRSQAARQEGQPHDIREM